MIQFAVKKRFFSVEGEKGEGEGYARPDQGKVAMGADSVVLAGQAVHREAGRKRAASHNGAAEQRLLVGMRRIRAETVRPAFCFIARKERVAALWTQTHTRVTRTHTHSHTC